MNQLTVQILKLQDRVNSLNDSRDLHDPEKGSSDSLTQTGTRNSFGSPGNFFLKNPFAPDERAASCSGHVYARNLSATYGEPVSLHTGKPAARVDEMERNSQNLALLTLRFTTKFSTWNPLPDAQRAYLQNYMVEQPRNHVLEMHFDKFPLLSTFQ